MRHESVWNARNLARRFFAAVVALSLSVSTADAQRVGDRASWEEAVGGITREEKAAQQLRLRTELAESMPEGALSTPIRVELTDKDRADLAEPYVTGTPLRIGVVKRIAPAVRFTRGQAPKRGVMQDTADGGYVWAVAVISPGAQAIRVNLSKFSLPDGAELHFYSPEGVADGPYVGRERNGNAEFWTRSVSSDTGVIQLRVPGDVDRKTISFAISELAHISGRVRDGGPTVVPRSHDTWPCSSNIPCLVDANCVSGSAADPAKDAVAKMEWITGPFVNTCSGGLLADTDAGSQIPYMLTANHCFSASIANLETWFNYTTNACNGVCPHNILTGGAPPSDTVGFTVLRTNSASDFTLGTLDQAPPAGAVFLGWNSTPIANTNGANLYRISNPNFGPQAYSQHDVDTSSPTCGGIPRGGWIYSADITGATEGGSSGSPVLNSASEVVGQLTGCCGFNCADDCAGVPTNWTIDGAFAAYFGQVSDLLDPAPGCTSDPECDDGLFCTGTETCVSSSCQSSGDPCTGGTTCNEVTDTCDAPACDNDNTCEAGEDCNNCPNDCRSKVNGNPNSRYCCDGDLPDCGDSRCSESGFSCGGGGSCTSDPDCDDGQFCNGAETCSGGSCQSGSDPCPGQGCDEGSNQCVTCGANKDPCTTNGDCCSNNCRSGSCRGN